MDNDAVFLGVCFLAIKTAVGDREISPAGQNQKLIHLILRARNKIGYNISYVHMYVTSRSGVTKTVSYHNNLGPFVLFPCPEAQANHGCCHNKCSLALALAVILIRDCIYNSTTLTITILYRTAAPRPPQPSPSIRISAAAQVISQLTTISISLNPILLLNSE